MTTARTKFIKKTRLDIVMEDIKKIEDERSSEMQHQILLGSLFGDMCCRKESVNAMIEESHSIKQKGYLEWKHHNLKGVLNLCLKTLDKRICEVNGKKYIRKQQLIMRSRVSQELNKYHSLFYEENKKRVTLETLKEIDVLGLAVWYCDDGHYDLQNHRVDIHTEGFSIEENQLIQGWFKEKWSLNAKLKKIPVKEQILIVFSVEDSEKFLRLIKDEILKMPEDVRYKLGHLWEGNKVRLETAKMKKRARDKIYLQREEVKSKRNEISKEVYYKNREEILKRRARWRKTEEYKSYLQSYLQRPEVKEKIRRWRINYRKTAKYKTKYNKYRKEYRRKIKESLKLFETATL